MTATLTIELQPEVSQKLAELSARTRQPAAELAAEAVASYVEHESRIREGVARGLADMKAGRLVPHDEAMDELDAILRYKAQRKSFATADLPEEKAEAIATSRMDNRHDRLAALLDE